MKTVKVLSKNKAIQSVGKQTYRIMKYDMGKYKGTPKEYFGRDMETAEDILAIYAESRKDSYGKYVQLMCLIEVEQ